MSTWDFSPSWFSVLVCLVVGVAALWIFFSQIKLFNDKRVFWVELLRLIATFMLLFTLFAPERVTRSAILREPVLSILVDKSGSMTTQDVPLKGGDIATREAWIESQMSADFWKPLKEAYKVEIEEFGAPDPDSDDPGTDINEALSGILNRYENLRAVLLLSDGDWNEGKNPTTAAAVLQSRGVPVYGAVVGSDRYLADVELADVKAPTYGLLNESLSLPFTVQSRLREDLETKVELIGPEGIISEKNIRLPAGGQVQDSILLEPDREGTFEYTVRVPFNAAIEAFTNNNETTFNIAMRQTTNRVLVVDSLPRWEYRFLRNALSRDPTVKVDCLLLHPSMKVGGGQDYIDRFPKRDELSNYDVVFLGDVGIGPNELTEENCNDLKGLVEEQGSGLVFLPGQRGAHASLMKHPIMELNPVVYDERSPKGTGFSSASKLLLTSRGRGHLLTMLAGEAENNATVWKGLPGFYWYGPVQRAKPGSTVLAVHETARGRGGRLPLIVTKNAGYGKALFMGTDSAWRWRRGVEDRYHYRFWRQVVRWMAHQRHLVNKDGVRFFYTPESPKRGEPVFLHATIFDRSGFPLQTGTVRASIEDSLGAIEEFDLTPEDGGWGVFTGTFTPQIGGNYRIKIDCEDAGRSIETKVQVSSFQRERTGRPARGNVLRELAAITNGRSEPVSRFTSLFESLQDLDEATEVEQRYRLWADWRWMGFVILLLAIYWVSRKLLGMI